MGTEKHEEFQPQEIVYRARQTIVWIITGAGIFFWLLVPLFGWMPFGVAEGKPRFGILVVIGLLCAFLGLMGTWMALLANRLRRVTMTADDEGVYLFTNIYEWYMGNPWNIREARLRWDDIKGVRLRRMRGIGEPGTHEEAQKHYILHTTKGRFILSSFVWPQVEQMVELIRERAGCTLSDRTQDLHLPAELAEEARITTSEKVWVWIVRTFGWICFGIGLFAAALLILMLVAEPKAGFHSGARLGTIVVTMILLGVGFPLMKFKVD